MSDYLENTTPAAQLAQLRRLIGGVYESNGFYRRKWERCGVGPEVESLQDFSERFPFTTKEEFVADQKENPPYGTNLTHARELYTRCHQTSGTTGMPLRWLDTPESWQGMIESWRRVFGAAGAKQGDTVFFAFSFGPFLGFWLAFDAAQQHGCICVPAGGMSSESRAKMVLDLGATFLCCTPTYGIRLAEVARQEKLNLGRSKVRRIIVAGEPGGSLPATRRKLEELWPGATVFDHHGMTEVGPVTYECPRGPGKLHVMEQSYLAEVIDSATGKPAEPGAPGELVLTTLRRGAAPAIRYRTGDLVRPVPRPGREAGEVEPCACGSTDLMLDGGILGRVDDMVIVRGVNVYPGAIEEIVRSCPEVAEYQVQISQAGALTEMTLRIEPGERCTDPAGLARQIEKACASAFALRIPVTLVERGTLPRFEMKAKRWLRL